MHPLLLATRLFLEPLKVWDAWPWLLLPLCFAVSIVYKSVRIDSMNRILIEAAKTTAWIVAGMGAAAGALLLIVNFISR